MRKLFGADRSAVLREPCVERATREHPPLDLQPDSGVVHGAARAAWLEDLRRDGLVVLEARLPEVRPATRSRALATEARSASCAAGSRARRPRLGTTRSDTARRSVRRARRRTCSPRPRCRTSSPTARCWRWRRSTSAASPVQDMVAMWWTTPSREGSSAAAQQFHFDLDRLQFLKVFVYLTDVGPENGPHEFVRGSHRHLPVALRADRRFSDEEVLEHYGAEDRISVTGARGTIFVADTRRAPQGCTGACRAPPRVPARVHVVVVRRAGSPGGGVGPIPLLG